MKLNKLIPISLTICLALFAGVSDALSCDQVPSLSEIEEMSKLNFYTGNDADADVDASVLTLNLKCMREACDAGSELSSCVDKLGVQFSNMMQFAPLSAQDQLQKACDCQYEDVNEEQTADGKVSTCSTQYTYNCPAGEKVCMNANAYLFSKKACGDADDGRKEVQEVMEYFRVNRYCNDKMKAVLTDENIVPPRCTEQEAKQNALKTACSSSCYYWMRENEPKITDYDGGNMYQDADYYNWQITCGKFVDEETGNAYFEDTVFYQGNKNVWHQMIDVCDEFREDNAPGAESMTVPGPMQFTAVTKQVVTDDMMTAALDKCCKPHNDDGSSPYAGLVKSGRSLEGQAETKCLAKESVLYDFGFIPSVLRGAMTKYSKQCWMMQSKKETCTPMGGEPVCDEAEPMQQMDLDSAAAPSEIFWFLKYLDGADKTAALDACLTGASVGRSVTALPGLALGLEAQEYAVTKVPSGVRAISLLAFQQCAVFQSVHNNDYFVSLSDGGKCNEDALNFKSVRSDCPERYV